MIKTTNLNLNMPEYTEAADVNYLNENMSKLDYEVSRKINNPSGATSGKFLQINSRGDVVWGEAASEDAILSAARQWMDDNFAGQGQAVAVDSTLSVSGLAADARKTGEIKESIHDVLVGNPSIGQVTLQNVCDTQTFYNNAVISTYGSKRSYDAGVATFTARGNNTQVGANYAISAGENKWMIGFKYRLTRNDVTAPEPDAFRVWHDTVTPHDTSVVYNSWMTYFTILTVNFTRLFIQLRGFSETPPENSYTIEIKEMYVYNVNNISDELLSYIRAEQDARYSSGTTTFGTTEQRYLPDTSLTLPRKAADAKAVGDAFDEFRQVFDYTASGSSVTLTPVSDINSFNSSHTRENVRKLSFENGIMTFESTGADYSCNVKHQVNAGQGKWAVGLKYKITKANSSVPTPSYIRFYLGGTYYDYPVILNEWVSLTKVAEVNLTRVYFLLRCAQTPASGDIQYQIRDVYAYDVTNVSSDLIEMLQDQQESDYLAGTATFGDRIVGYLPTKSFTKTGKCVESRAVGKALDNIRINVKNYGIVGDNVTDNTDAINRLFETKEGTFYFPKGTYKITGTLMLPSNCEFCGDGDQTVFNMASCDRLNSYSFRTTDPVYPYIAVDNKSNVRIHHIKLVGNNTLQYVRHAGICITDSTNCTVEDCTVYNINYYASQDQEGPSPRVMGYGIMADRSSYIVFQRCQVEQCGYECIGIVDDCDHCVVRDCYAKNGWRTGIQVHRGSCNTTVENNYVIQDEPSFSACLTIHGLENQLVKNLRIINNTFECTRSHTSTTEYAAPAQLMAGMQNVFFIGNRILGGKRAFYVYGPNANPKIIGNDFHCNSDSDYCLHIESPNTVFIGNKVVNDAVNKVNNIYNSPVMYANIGLAAAAMITDDNAGNVTIA